MGTKWNKALRETQTGAEVNPAGKLRQALVGTPEDKQKMAVMLPPGSVQAFDDLMEAAQGLARTPNSGSNTMRDTQIAESLKGTAAVAYRFLTTPRAAIRDAAEQKRLDDATKAIAEAILNPAKRAQLRQVVRMSDTTKKAAVLSTILGGQVAARLGAPGDDRMPSAPTQ